MVGSQWFRPIDRFQQSPGESGFGYGYFPCASGCEGSPSDVRFCTCRCQGINHGRLLRHEPPRPIPIDPRLAGSFPSVEYPVLEAPALLPHIEQAPTFPASRPVTIETKPLKRPSLKRKIGRSIVNSLAGRIPQAQLNETILHGLGNQFRQDRVDAIVDQAFTIFFARVGSDSNHPELYELYENGDIDKALAHFGVRWVIGRPKLK